MNKITKVLLKSFITNILLSVVKIISGIIGKSGALIADGIHSLSDTITDVFAILGHKLSTKPADDKHPYGHGKIEYITCIGIAIVITLMGISIIYNAIFEERIIPSIYAAIIALIVIMAKLVLAKYLLRKGTQYESNILIASGKESMSDVISSVVVLMSILIANLDGIFVYADTIAMIIVGILILKIAYNIFKDNFSNLLGEKITDSNYIKQIEEIIYSIEETKNIDELIILKYGSTYQVTCEISMDENLLLKEAHEIAHQIENKLKEFDDRLKHIIIHINPYNVD